MTNPVPQLRVRWATPADLDTVVAFNVAMAWETEGKELDLARLRAGVEAVLRDPDPNRGRGFYLVAEIPPSPLLERGEGGISERGLGGICRWWGSS